MRLLSAALLAAGLLAGAANVSADAASMVSDLSGKRSVARFEPEEGLTALGDKALPALRKLVMKRGFALDRQYAIQIVGRIGTDSAAKILLKVLKNDPDVRVRDIVCYHLGRLGVEEPLRKKTSSRFPSG